MATALFNYFYAGTITTILSGDITNADPGFQTINYTDPLNPGDPVSGAWKDGVPFPSGTYLGKTFDGGLVFQFGSDYALLTDTAYDLGDPFPTYSAVIFCFLAGTLIATPNGARAVETLTIGDDILAADGRIVSVKWVGRQTLSTRFGLPEHRAPVLLETGALGRDLPERDLRITADHALLLDGVLVQAGALVNGTTIRRMTAAELGDKFDIFHIETDAHDLVLAEGVPAETFIDNVARKGFDNYAEFEALYGTPAEPLRELEQPRIMSARQVPAALRARIAAAARTDLDAVA